MKQIIHRAADRGFADHGWLKSHHTFSFANYYNPEMIHFGALRVLNDDWVKGGMGFGSHPHDNMEIVSIVLNGALAHKDNTGRDKVIQTNEIQIMSAGTGMVHSEFNASKTEDVNFLQIWVFPKHRNVHPRYDQLAFDPQDRHNKMQVVISPEQKEGQLWLHQDAWFSLGNFDAGQQFTIAPKQAGIGSYLFLISGEAKVGDDILQAKDAIGISDYQQLEIEVNKSAEFLLIDVPMLQ
ncbi:MAG: pirin family protein [Chitinophaga sp.]|uniref:pirin family protein n=1 Tax=Chitinophaga sp. TaxID=1869181 RepID=UPI0025BC5073|nr:pirin family protein [Chitinophaga sp.]MBV8255057.1 pirin family protein [Chitinophaga sp.]